MYPALYSVAASWIGERSRVLDLGTGEGRFLSSLIKEKAVHGEGVEKDPELVAQCIERGLVVHQGDIMDGLDQYATSSFDFVLLLGTFQELVDLEDTLEEAFRVGRRLIIAYHNFSYWRLRFEFMLKGKTPVAAFSKGSWYSSPNRHIFSIDDFEEFLAAKQIREIRSAYFNARGRVRLFPNLLADQVLSELVLS